MHGPTWIFWAKLTPFSLQLVLNLIYIIGRYTKCGRKCLTKVAEEWDEELPVPAFRLLAEQMIFTVRARRGRLIGLSVFLCKSVLYGAFVWACRALNSQKRRFPAGAVVVDVDAPGNRRQIKAGR